ncbi:MAG: protein kinase [Candidatus Eisenbacteria bacterium]
MTLEPGTRLGPYEIVAPLGAGGMGEVYRARDTRLGRDVAIKALPEGFENDAERVARFEREAKLLASLQHTNIGSIFGLEVVEGRRHLVLEFIEGETLQMRLSRGALPAGEALEVCAQIATALEAAHEAGVIHRDLKPGNVMLKSDGTVKVLDFGLAKSSAPDGAAPAGDLSASPTMTYAATGVGVILGTAAYMSPEQARGKHVDRRTDIWSFGCVLYECLCGRRMIEGETVSDMVARILERDPEWSALPANTPAHVKALLKRCLTKDARARLRDIGEARIVLASGMAPAEPAGFAPEATAPASAPAPRRAGWRHGLALVAVALAGLALGVLLPLRRSANDGDVTRLSLLPTEQDGELGDIGSYAISPDGRTLVFSMSDSSSTVRLYVRGLGDTEARRLDGTEGATWPFWSPDSRQVGFFSDGRLRKIAAAGGAVLTVCEASNGRGGAWGAEGRIVFAPDARGGLWVVAAAGGAPRQVTWPNTARGDMSHRFPVFLPDGKHFLFAVNSVTSGQTAEIRMGTADGAPTRALLESSNAVAFAAPDLVVFTRDRALLVQRVDLRACRPIGEPRLLEDQPELQGGVQLAPPVSSSLDGRLVYVSRDQRPSGVSWVEDDGRLTPTRVRFPIPSGVCALSPDGRRIAIAVTDANNFANWIGDLETGEVAQVAPSGKGVQFPIWTPAGNRLVGATISGVRQLDPASGADSSVELGDNVWRVGSSWTPDGGTLVMDATTEGARMDIQVLPWKPGARPVPWLATKAAESMSTLSHDGRALAYVSDASGRNELYVDGFPAHTQAVRVGPANSTLQGPLAAVAWRADDRRLYYVGGDGYQLMAVDVNLTPSPSVGAPRVVCTIPREVSAVCLLADGRMLALAPEGSYQRSLTVVTGWQNEKTERK